MTLYPIDSKVTSWYVRVECQSHNHHSSLSCHLVALEVQHLAGKGRLSTTTNPKTHGWELGHGWIKSLHHLEIWNHFGPPNFNWWGHVRSLAITHLDWVWLWRMIDLNCLWSSNFMEIKSSCGDPVPNVFKLLFQGTSSELIFNFKKHLLKCPLAFPIMSHCLPAQPLQVKHQVEARLWTSTEETLM